MALIFPIKLRLAAKLRNKAFRTRFFRKRAQDEIALQIQEIRKKREKTQADLAKLCSMKQSAVSRIEQADYSAWNFKTLLRVAGALDARLRVVLEPAEDVIKQHEESEQYVSGTSRVMTGISLGPATYAVGGGQFLYKVIRFNDASSQAVSQAADALLINVLESDANRATLDNPSGYGILERKASTPSTSRLQ